MGRNVSKRIDWSSQMCDMKANREDCFGQGNGWIIK